MVITFGWVFGSPSVYKWMLYYCMPTLISTVSSWRWNLFPTVTSHIIGMNMPSPQDQTMQWSGWFWVLKGPKKCNTLWRQFVTHVHEITQMISHHKWFWKTVRPNDAKPDGEFMSMLLDLYVRPFFFASYRTSKEAVRKWLARAQRLRFPLPAKNSYIS